MRAGKICIADHIINEGVLYDAYTSASTATNGYPIDGEYLVHFEINSIAGKNMAGYGNNSESEILFCRNTLFVTDKIIYDHKGIPTIYLTEVSNEQTTVSRGRNQETLSVDNRGQQEISSESHKTEVQQLSAYDSENSEVQSASGRNTDRDTKKQGNLSGVQAEVKSADKSKKQSKREQITVSTRDMILDSLATEGLNTNELRSVNAYRNRISRINELVEERSRVEIELIEIINQKGSEAASRRSELRVKKNNLTQRITREESLLYEQEKTKYIRKVATDVMVKRIEAAVENGEMPEVARYTKEITTLFENRIASLRKSEEDKRVMENTSRSNVIAARGVFCFVLIIKIHYTLSCDL